MNSEIYNGKSWVQTSEKKYNDSIGMILGLLITPQNQKQMPGFCCSDKNNIGAVRMIYPTCNDVYGLRRSSTYITNSSKEGISKNLSIFWIEGIGKYNEGKFYSVPVSRKYSKAIIRLFEQSIDRDFTRKKMRFDSLSSKIKRYNQNKIDADFQRNIQRHFK